jgi:hypothetical protein
MVVVWIRMHGKLAHIGGERESVCVRETLHITHHTAFEKRRKKKDNIHIIYLRTY